MLNNHFDFESVRVLDLFAGTGNLSFEFASRGAVEVLAIEQQARCVEFIRHTARRFGMDNLRVVRADAFRFLGQCSTDFELIFADPPYDSPGIDRIPSLVYANGLLAKGGWLIVEHTAGEQFANHPAFIQLRKYGRVHFSIFEA